MSDDLDDFEYEVDCDINGIVPGVDDEDWGAGPYGWDEWAPEDGMYDEA